MRDSAQDFCHTELLPGVVDAYREERYDPELLPKFGALGMLGSTLSESYGCAGLNHVCYGLLAREVERVDSGYRSAMSVQSSLVMHPIYAFERRSATEIPAQTGHCRAHWLFWPHRTRSR